MIQIAYYASKLSYLKKGKKTNAYFIKTLREETSIKGPPDCLTELAKIYHNFYIEYGSDITLINCPKYLEKKGFRPLNDLEEKILKSALIGESNIINSENKSK